MKGKKGFQKGHKHGKGKPKGSAPPPDMNALAARVIDKNLVNQYITANSHLTRKQLQQRLKDLSISILEERIIKGLLGSSRETSFASLDPVFNRLIGKVPDKIEHGLLNPHAGKTIEQLVAEKEALAAANRITLQAIEKEAKMREDLEAKEAAPIDVTPNPIVTPGDSTPTD